MAYGNGRYVLVGQQAADDNGFVQTSEDGINWTMRTTLNYAVLDLYDVTFGNGVFVAAGWGYFGGPQIYHSTNGINWTPHSMGAGNLHGVISGGDRFVAVGDPFDTNNHNIFVSLNGNTWSPRSSGFSDAIYDVAYGAGRFVAVDGASHIYNSPTGTTWTRTTGSNSGRFVSFCFDRFIVPAGTGINLVSVDGLAWWPVSNNSGATFTRIIYAGGYYVALSLYSDVFTSTDGINWVHRNLPPTQGVFRNLTAINFVAGKVIVGGYTYTGDSRPRLPLLYISDSFASVKINLGNPPNLTVSGLTNRSYRIEYLTDLQSNDWQPLSTFILTDSPFTWLDSSATNSSRYYRAVLLP